MTTILNPSFEGEPPTGFGSLANWTFESDGSGSEGIQTTYFTDGSFGTDVNFGGTINATYGRAYQTISFNSDFVLQIDFKFTETNSNIKFRVWVDNDVLYELAADNSAHTNVSVNVFGYSGNHSLKFGLFDSTPQSTSHTVYVDNLRVTNEVPHLNNVYVNSSTGNDSNIGDSCAAGHPVLTFGKAYGLLNPDGTIFICNDGADFSGETLTSNKGYSIAQGTAGVASCISPKFN